MEFLLVVMGVQGMARLPMVVEVKCHQLLLPLALARGLLVQVPGSQLHRVPELDLLWLQPSLLQTWISHTANKQNYITFFLNKFL